MLGAHARRGATLVVAEPMCLRAIAVEYPRALGGDEVKLVADATRDPCEVVGTSGLVVTADDQLDYLTPCHVRPGGTTPAAIDLLRGSGLRVRVRSGCAPGGPSASAQVGECEHAVGRPHPLEVLASLRPGTDWGHSGPAS